MILTEHERLFLDVFLHEATTAPFAGPATDSLHGLGVEYADIPSIVWAYEQDNPRTHFEVGHAAETAPPLPWATRDEALERNRELHRVWERNRQPAASI